MKWVLGFWGFGVYTTISIEAKDEIESILEGKISSKKKEEKRMGPVQSVLEEDKQFVNEYIDSLAES